MQAEGRIFHYEALGSEPGLLVFEHRQGVTRVTMRGEPTLTQVTDPQEGLITVTTAGPFATLAVPAADVAALALALLELAPVEDMIGKIPHVCWFDTTEQRDEFIRLVNTHDPVHIELRRDR